MHGNEIRKATFLRESDLCAEFVKYLPEGWTAYPETHFDLLLVRKDGYQVGIEAKLTLNAKVIEQIAPEQWADRPGPDFRAVLVPHGVAGSLLGICELIGITVIAMKDDAMMEGWRYRGDARFNPPLPELSSSRWQKEWFDFCPHKRIDVPDYVPDVTAGASAPRQLSAWKVKAIKICVLLEKRGWVARSDFAFLQIDMRRWIGHRLAWLKHGPQRGIWLPGETLPNFRREHPVNYEQIAADFAKWKPPEPEIQMSLEDLSAAKETKE